MQWVNNYQQTLCFLRTISTSSIGVSNASLVFFKKKCISLWSCKSSSHVLNATPLPNVYYICLLPMCELSFLIPKGFRRIGIPFLFVGVWRANIFPSDDVSFLRFLKIFCVKSKQEIFVCSKVM